jgi:transcriptional regulator with XRE-family HTH domain
MKTEIIERGGKRFAVIPLKQFERLSQDAEALDDIRAYDAAKARKEEAFPAELADRLAQGESPVRVFREYRGLTQQKLAAAARIARPYLAEIESGRKSGSVAVLRALAKALKLDLDDIAWMLARCLPRGIFMSGICGCLLRNMIEKQYLKTSPNLHNTFARRSLRLHSIHCTLWEFL